MKQEIIDKLPPDAQKEFLKLAMKLDEKTKQDKVHNDFLGFVKHVWPEFIEGKLYDYPEFSYIAKFYKEKEDFYKIELLVKWKREGRIKKRYFYGYLRRK